MNGKAQAMATSTGEARISYLPDTQWYAYLSPRHSLQFILPREFLDRLADDVGARPVEQLGYGADVVSDPVLVHFARKAMPYVQRPESLDRLWADHFMSALALHVCSRHGDLITRGREAGGLSPWQMRAAADLIEASLADGVSLGELSDLCGVGQSQFAHAFRRSFGAPPHRWLLDRRIEQSKRQLLSGEAIVDVALACGFADQSHFTRVFRDRIGATPRAWRASFA
jgi:AraC family transcriptional regulator